MNQSRETTFSPCRRYRYTLWRQWPIEELERYECSAETRAHEYLMVIGLNPSTADETKDDPTIRKCMGFAKRWGFGALCMTNLFAWRDTSPELMKQAFEPVGLENDQYIANCAHGSGMILAAWGKHGAHNDRAIEVQSIMDQNLYCLHALRRNKDGSPMHPLYVSYETKPILLITV